MNRQISGMSFHLAAIDLRSLAAFRVGAALIILADLLLRARDLAAFYTDLGVLPRSARIELYEAGDVFGRLHMWSLHLASGQAWWQIMLLLLAVFAACCMLIGYRTRLAATASWILLLSLDARNPMVLNSGDVLLRSMLFWSLFLPLGARWSVDRRVSVPVRREVLSMASLALLLQLAMMYFFSGLFKWHPTWLSEANGVYYALHCDAYATALGAYLRQFGWLTYSATLATVALELLGPCLAFCPWQTARIRTAAVFVFWSFHLGLAATLTIGLFAPICLAAWLVFLPGSFWDAVEKRWGRRRGVRAVMLRFTLLQRSLQEMLPLAPTTTVYASSWSRCKSISTNLLVGALLIYLVLWNFRELDVAKWEKRILPRQYNGIARALGLDQNWSMFSPIPRTEDGWLVMRGVQRDGREVNLWNPGEPLPYDKPANVSGTYKRQRWRKYLDNLTTEDHAVHRMYFADWLQREWNRRYADGDPEREIVEVQLLHRIELTPPPGNPIPAPETRVLWTWYYE